MSERIDLLDLSLKERQAAARVVAAVADKMPWERVEAVFRSLGRAEWLLVPRPETLQGVLPMQSPTLLRNERVMATAILLALHMWLDDEVSSERVITYLAQRGAALDALFIHEAAAMSTNGSSDAIRRAVL